MTVIFKGCNKSTLKCHQTWPSGRATHKYHPCNAPLLVHQGGLREHVVMYHFAVPSFW